MKTPLPNVSWRRLFLLPLLLALAGCATTQVFPTLNHRNISLQAGALEKSGLAFITPSTVTGQEEEKQGVALVFASAFGRARPAIHVSALPDTINAVNRAGIEDGYRRMYAEYRDTGLFPRERLQEVAKATGARYIAQIKLQGFGQGAKERFGALGFRIVETRFVNVRVFLQIWDGTQGTIAWEGMAEILDSKERVSEQPEVVSLALDRAAVRLLELMP